MIRSGFQALQLLIADYLPALADMDLPLVVVVVCKFGLQHVDINISLTAIGLLWTMADFMYQNKERITLSLKGQSLSPLSNDILQNLPAAVKPCLIPPFLKTLSNSTLPPMDRIWLLLFGCLGDMCIDDRGAVRKSASQTLFSTVTAHGTQLDHTSWTVSYTHLTLPTNSEV